MLKGLRDAGVDLTAAELIVGTSAGAYVGSQVAAGLDLAMLVSRQLEPPDSRFEGRSSGGDFFGEMQRLGSELGPLIASADPAEPGLPQPAHALIGRKALMAQTASEAERLTTVGHRLAVTDWPDRRLLITAIDAEDGFRHELLGHQFDMQRCAAAGPL